jgi:hypothetical protein
MNMVFRPEELRKVVLIVKLRVGKLVPSSKRLATPRISDGRWKVSVASDGTDNIIAPIIAATARSDIRIILGWHSTTTAQVVSGGVGWSRCWGGQKYARG